MNRVKLLGNIGFCVAFLVPAAASAQVARPATVEPGRASQPLRIDERPQVGGESVIVVPDQKGPQKPLKGETTFTLTAIKFENLTAFTEEELRPEYASLLGTKISLSTLNGIVSKITVHYRNAGFILSRAVIPPQRIKDGVVTIRIVEGYINAVEFQGLPSAAPGLLGRYAQKIRDTKPLDAATLERYLLLINDLPGVSAQAVLRPAQSVPGASDAIITVTQKKIDGSVTADNRGSRYLGPVQGGVTVNANNMLGVYDRTTLRGVMTDPVRELKFGEIVHEEQLDSEGTKLALSAGYTRTHPGYTLKSSEVFGRDVVYSAVVSHPFLRSRQSNLFGTAQFDIRNTDLDTLRVKVYDDRLKVARVGGSYDFVDRFTGVNHIETTVSQGVGWDVTSSIASRSRPAGKPNFTKATATATRLQPVSGPVNLYVAATGQAASNALLSAEQFGVGGANFGSAYDSSEITGDSGVAGRVELQYSPSGDSDYVPNYQVYGFYDGGVTWLRNTLPGQSQQSLVSTGLGVRFNAIKDISGGLEVALPLTKPVAANGADGMGPRVFFNLAYRY